MSFLSIDIGTNSIAVVQGTVGPGTISVSMAETAPLKSGTIINSSIRDQGELVSAITNVIQRRSFRENKTIVTISPANALIREFSVPAGKPKQVEAIVRNEMIASYGAVDSDVIEYLKLSDEISENDGKLTKVRALALHMDMVSGYHDAMMAAKLKPFAMDFHSNSIRKYMERRPKINDMDLGGKSFLLLDFGFTGVMTYIVVDYKVVDLRFIPIGLADLKNVVMANRFDVDGEDDTRLNLSELLDFSDGQADSTIMKSAREVITQLCTEIEKLIMFSSTRHSQINFTAAFLYGGGGMIPGIDKAIASEIRLDTQPLVSTSGIHFENDADEKNLLRYFNAVSALIRL